jgi:hypothetical protein
MVLHTRDATVIRLVPASMPLPAAPCEAVVALLQDALTRAQNGEIATILILSQHPAGGWIQSRSESTDGFALLGKLHAIAAEIAVHLGRLT